MTPIAIDPAVAQRVAGALIHFLWQGAVIGLIVAIVLRVLSRRKPEVRYAVAIAALALMTLAPIGTFVFYTETGALAARAIEWLNHPARGATETRTSPAETTIWAEWILIGWVAGVAVFLTRLFIGWRLARRLVRSAVDATPANVRDAFAQVAQLMKVSGRVRLMLHSQVDSPVAIGWLRPVVLAPISWISGLNEAQLSAIFAHELAHIRRHDFLINMLQRSVESVFFYHPAVWWLSNRIRVEREHCCDDLAIRICGSRKLYAEALMQMERARQTPALVVAAADGAVLKRFRRVLGMRDSYGDWQSVAATALFTAMLALIAVWPSTPIQALPVVFEPVAPPVLQSTPGSAQPAPPVANPLGAIAAILTGSQSTVIPSAPQGPEATNIPSLEGFVVRLGSGDPIGGVAVELSRAQDFGSDRGGGVTGARNSSTGRGGPLAPTSAPAKTFTIVTGEDGKFSFADLEPGEYRLAAVKPGGAYVPVEYGQRDPKGPGARIAVTATGGLRGIRLEMLATGSISGRITDGDGEPVANARVEAIALQYRRSEPRVDARIAVNQPVMSVVQAVYTNDRGEYRLYWLTPGRYLVGVRVEDPRRRASMVYTPGPGQTESNQGAFPPILINRILPGGERVEETYQLVFFGGHTDAQKALTVEVQPGMTIGAIDVAVDAGLRRARHIRGVVTNRATGQPFAGASLRVVPVTHSPDVIVPSATANNQGVFDISGVAPGSYLLYAWSGESTASPPMPIEVSSRDIENVGIVAGPTFNLSGRITIEGRPNDPAVRNVRIHMVRVPTILGMPSGRVPQGVPAADGSFTVEGVWPGRRLMAVNELPAGTYVKSILLGGRDVMNDGFEPGEETEAQFDVVLGNDGGSIEGRVLDQRLQAVVNAVVVLVPGPNARKRADLYKDTWSDGAGRFRFANVPPGEYTIFAWEYVDDGLWQDTEFMRREESRGRPVRIGSGAKENIDLTVLARPK